MIEISSRKILAFLLILSAFAAFASPVFVLKVHASTEDEAVSAIGQAEDALASAYEAVLEAEGAGADVSGLLAQLNLGGENLAEAHFWLSLGDYDNATRFADLCYDVGDEVKNEALELENEAYEAWANSLFLSITVSVVGVVAVVFLGFLCWRAFKRRYLKRVLGMKPEVAEDES